MAERNCAHVGCRRPVGHCNDPYMNLLLGSTYVSIFARPGPFVLLCITDWISRVLIKTSKEYHRLIFVVIFNIISVV